MTSMQTWILDFLTIFVAVPFLLLPWAVLLWILKKVFGRSKKKDEVNNG